VVDWRQATGTANQWTIARECLIESGVRPILTDIASLDEAVQAYLDGSIEDHVELLH
jgi:hypothetical protein